MCSKGDEDHRARLRPVRTTMLVDEDSPFGSKDSPSIAEASSWLFRPGRDTCFRGAKADFNSVSFGQSQPLAWRSMAHVSDRAQLPFAQHPLPSRSLSRGVGTCIGAALPVTLVGGVATFSGLFDDQAATIALVFQHQRPAA